MTQAAVLMAAEPSLTMQSFSTDLCARFVAFIDASPKTVETYKRALRPFAKWIQAHRVTAPTREDILAYRDDLKAKLKPATVQMYITVVRLFFQWLEAERLYKDVAAHIKGAKIDREHKKDALTASQVKDVLGAIDRSSLQGKRDYAMLRLMLTGGLRTVEVMRANISDLRTISGYSVLYVQGKGREERTDYIKLTPATERPIREYLAARGKCSGHDPLFASTSNNSRGGRLSTRSISATVKTCFIQAGYDSDRLTAHSTRHTAVTLALLGGATLQEAQQFARHSKVTTTEIYAHNLERVKNPCESLIDAAIS